MKRGVMWFIPLVLRPRATHEGNKSHNPELKADKWLIFTLARIPQGMQKYIDEECLYCSFFFCFLTLHAGTCCWKAPLSGHVFPVPFFLNTFIIHTSKFNVVIPLTELKKQPFKKLIHNLIGTDARLIHQFSVFSGYWTTIFKAAKNAFQKNIPKMKRRPARHCETGLWTKRKEKVIFHGEGKP